MKKEFIASWNNHSTQVIETEGLTENEVSCLIASRINEYSDCLDNWGRNSEWCFTIIDNSGLTASVARGVISSLIKKGLCTVSDEKKVNDRTFQLTKDGAKRFSDYDEVNDRLIEAPKNPVDKTATEKNVTLMTFTGMVIGTYEAKLENVLWEVETKKGVLRFDYQGRQVGATNPKFANIIKF